MPSTKSRQLYDSAHLDIMGMRRGLDEEGFFSASRAAGRRPPKKVRTGPGFKDLLEFQAGSLADFLRDSNRTIKSVNPGIVFSMNGGARGANRATARFSRVLEPEQDLLGSEGGFIGGDLRRVSLWQPGLTARLLETQAPGKAQVIFLAASHKPRTFSVLPVAELRLLYAGCPDCADSKSAAWKPPAGALAVTRAPHQNGYSYDRRTKKPHRDARLPLKTPWLQTPSHAEDWLRPRKELLRT